LARLPSRPALAFFALSVWLQAAGAAPLHRTGTGVNSNDFRITTFASGLDFSAGGGQTSMFAPGEISQGAQLFNSTGITAPVCGRQRRRDRGCPGSVLYANLPGARHRSSRREISFSTTVRPNLMHRLRAGVSPSAHSRGGPNRNQPIPAPGFTDSALGIARRRPDPTVMTCSSSWFGQHFARNNRTPPLSPTTASPARAGLAR